MDDAGAQGAHDVLEAGVDLAHFAKRADLRHEEAAQLENGHGADDASLGGDDRQHAHVVLVDQLEGLGAGGVLRHGDDVGHHEIAHARGDVGEEQRERLVETREDGVDAGVGVAATRGDEAGQAARLLVGGVADGGADGVGVGVFVADDVGRRDERGGRGHERGARNGRKGGAG